MHSLQAEYFSSVLTVRQVETTTTQYLRSRIFALIVSFGHLHASFSFNHVYIRLQTPPFNRVSRQVYKTMKKKIEAVIKPLLMDSSRWIVKLLGAGLQAHPPPLLYTSQESMKEARLSLQNEMRLNDTHILPV